MGRVNGSGAWATLQQFTPTATIQIQPSSVVTPVSGLNLNDLKLQVTLQLQSGSFPNSSKLLPACTRPDLYTDFLSYSLALKVRGDKEYGSFHFILPWMNSCSLSFKRVPRWKLPFGLVILGSVHEKYTVMWLFCKWVHHNWSEMIWLLVWCSQPGLPESQWCRHQEE